MSFDPNDLEKLAGTLVSAGAPILGGLIGGPFGAIVGSLLPQVAGALGLEPDARPAAINAVVAADPQAAGKLAELEEAQKDALASARLQVDQNEAELGLAGPVWARLLYSAWRPLMGWISGPVLMAYQIGAVTFGGRPVPMETFAPAMALWTALAGLRTSEKWQGVAAPLPMAAKGRGL